MFGNKDKEEIGKPSQQNNPAENKYEFVVRVVDDKKKSKEEKIIASAESEGAALESAIDTAKEKFTNAVEVSYTGKFKIIKKEK